MSLADIHRSALDAITDEINLLQMRISAISADPNPRSIAEPHLLAALAAEIGQLDKVRNRLRELAARDDR